MLNIFCVVTNSNPEYVLSYQFQFLKIQNFKNFLQRDSIYNVNKTLNWTLTLCPSD